MKHTTNDHHNQIKQHLYKQTNWMGGTRITLSHTDERVILAEMSHGKIQRSHTQQKASKHDTRWGIRRQETISLFSSRKM